MRKLLIIAIALVLAGCSGQLTTAPDDSTGEQTYPVHIEFGAESESGVIGTNGLVKDAGGIGYIDFGPGNIQSPQGEELRMIPEITLDALTTMGYEVVYNGVPSNPSAYIGCTGTYPNTVAMDVLRIVCDGVLPQLAEGDDFSGIARMNFYLRTLQEDGTDAAIRLNGINPNWPELDAAVQGQKDNLSQFDLAQHSYGVGDPLDKYDRYGCDGTAGADAYTPMLLEPLNDVIGINSAPDGTAFQMSMNVNAAMGEKNTWDGDLLETGLAYRCQGQTLKPFTFALNGLEDGINLQRDTYKECMVFLNDYNLPSENFCNVFTIDSDAVVAYDYDGTPITNSATDVIIGHHMAVDFDGYTMDADTINAANHVVQITTEPLPNGITSANIDSANYVLYDDGDGVDDMFSYALVNAFEAEQMTISDSWMNVKDINGATLSEGFGISYTAAWSVSHAWHVSTIESGNEVHKLDDGVSFVVPNADNAVTVTDWATLTTLVSHNEPNSSLDIADDATARVLRFGNTLAAPDDDFIAELKFSYANALSAGDSYVVVIADNVNGKGYVFGVQVQDIGAGDEPCAVALQWSDASGGFAYDNGAAYALGAISDVIIRAEYDETGSLTMRFWLSTDGGASFNRMDAIGVKHPDVLPAGTAIPAYMDFPNNIIVAHEFANGDNGQADFNVQIDQLRLFGLTNADGALWTMFPDENPDFNR